MGSRNFRDLFLSRTQVPKSWAAAYGHLAIWHLEMDRSIELCLWGLLQADRLGFEGVMTCINNTGGKIELLKTLGQARLPPKVHPDLKALTNNLESANNMRNRVFHDHVFSGTWNVTGIFDEILDGKLTKTQRKKTAKRLKRTEYSLDDIKKAAKDCLESATALDEFAHNHGLSLLDDVRAFSIAK